MQSPETHTPREFDTVVLFIEGKGPEGGAERIGFSTAEVLLRAGYRVHIISSEDDLWPQYHHVPNLTFDCLNVDMVWDRWFGSGRQRMLLTLFQDKEMYNLIDEKLLPFDPKSTILHFHSHYAKFTPNAIQVGIDRGFRTTISCHDYGYICPNAMLYDYQLDSICPEVPLSKGCWKRHCLGADGHRLKQFRFIRAFVKHRLDGTYSNLKGIIAVSQFEASILRKYLPNSLKLFVLPNPVTPAATTRQTPETSKYVLWIGRMTQEKDPITAAIAADMAGIPIHFVGSGPFEEAILKNNPKAHLLGWKTTEEVSEAQRNARVVVMSSSCYETASLVVLESLAAGIPCVVPSLSAATSWVEHGVNGLHFEAGNPESLAEALELLKDDERVQKLSQAAFDKYWANPFSEDRYLKELLEVYQQL